MGQKVNPVGFRLGILTTWSSRWFADKHAYRKILEQDMRLRDLLNSKLASAGVMRIEIERSINRTDIILWVSRAGLVIGRGGKGLEELRAILVKELGEKDAGLVHLRVQHVEKPDLSAKLLAFFAAEQLVKRLPARRVMSQVVDRARRSGALGARVILSGRIGGAEIARVQKQEFGTIPLATLRADIDFAKADAHTKSGAVGVKVWVCRKGS